MSWVFEHGSYYYLEGLRAPQAMTDQVAIGYSRESPEMATLHRIGSPETVQAWLTKTRAMYVASAFPELANELGMVTLPRGYPVEEINRCMDTTGYIATMLKRIEAAYAEGEEA